MKALLFLPFLFSFNLYSHTIELSTSSAISTSLEINSAEIDNNQLMQLQSAFMQQLHLLEDKNYWPVATQFANSGQWPANTKLLKQAWQQCESWWKQQRNYHCRFGKSRQIWQQSSINQSHPDRVTLRREARRLITEDQAHILPDLQGYALAVLMDSIFDQAITLWPQADIRLQYGNWHRVYGANALTVVAFASTDNNELLRTSLRNKALVQANEFNRDNKFAAAVWYPAEGWPVQYGPEVAVSSSSFSRSWLLAHALASASPTQRQTWISEDDASLFRAFKNDDHTTPYYHASTNWFAQLEQAGQYQQQHEVQIELELPSHHIGSKRPYMSIWLANDNSINVAQILLLGEQSRWYQELRSWWRQTDKTSITNFDQMVGATRKPGIHHFVWNGSLANGKPLPNGDYTLWVEVARESGSREQLKRSLKWPLQSPLILKGQHEIGLISFQLKRSADVKKSKSLANKPPS